MRTRVRNAFTLVEILIVVVILGILAAIVVPQFTNATQDAQGGNIQAQLDTLNNQIELYRARTNAYPGAGGTLVGYDWMSMINPVAGVPGTGGYLKSQPKNPYNQSITIAASGASVPATDGWTWGPNANGIMVLGATNFDETTGKITPGVE
jgi:general secretion pathway protein G